MVFELEYDDLFNSLKKLCEVSAVKEGGVSKSLFIGASESQVVFSTTGEDIISYTHIHAKIKELGEIVIEAKLLFNLLAKLPKKSTIKFETIGKRTPYLLVSTENKEYEFDPMKVDFPLPNTSYYWDFELEAPIFMEMLNKTGWLYGVKMEDHTIMENVFFEFKNDEFNIISSDLNRFGCCSYYIVEETFDPKSVVVPNKMIKLLLKHLKDASSVEIFISDKYIKFKVDNMNYVCEVIEGEYLDIRKHLKEKGFFDKKKYSCVIKRLPFTKLLSRLNLFTDNIRSMLTFTCKLKKNIVVTSHNIGTKKNSREEIEADPWAGKAIYLGINGDKLFDVANKNKCEDLELVFTDSDSPLTVNLPDDSYDTFYLLKNLRTD